MNYRLSLHAEDALAKRNIPLAWIERVLAHPQRIEPDRSDAALEHRMAVIPEHGDRVLRVIINRQKRPELVVTAFFDRKMKGAL
jgi:uncharacterized DUF497 family protein